MNPIFGKQSSYWNGPFESSQYKDSAWPGLDSQSKDKTVVRPSYLYHWNPVPGKTVFIFKRAPDLCSSVPLPHCTSTQYPVIICRATLSRAVSFVFGPSFICTIRNQPQRGYQLEDNMVPGAFRISHQLRQASIALTAWWRRQMETFSALLTICTGNSPVPG